MALVGNVLLNIKMCCPEIGKVMCSCALSEFILVLHEIVFLL